MIDETLLDFSVTDYSDAAIYSKKDLIHKSKLNEILCIWDKLYQQSTNKKLLLDRKDIEVHSIHNTISIFASRGAGKTSFLLSFINEIKRNQEKYNDVLFLNRIDPSHIESKQHTFINILANIHNLIENEEIARNRGYVGTKYSETRIELNDYYSKILKALPFIDGVGKNEAYDDWVDEEYVSINGMECAKASNNIERNFHLYIKTALHYLDKKCIVIPFDDIDTDFEKGFEILEVIRKFLTTPQIITIITGDLELYSKLVRNAKWKFFKYSFIKKEIDYGNHTGEEFSEMINQLENQYLMKILKPENRILIKTIKEYLEEPDFSLRIKLTKDSKELTIRELYELLLCKLGFNENDYYQLTSFMMDLSLRAQIQMLILLKDSLNNDNNIYIASGLINVFWNDINQTANNPQRLLRANMSYCIDMLQYLVDTEKLYTNSNFLPESNNKTINKALLAISGLFNQLLTKTNYLLIDYWLRILYVRIVTEDMGGKENKTILNDFLNFSLFNTETRLIKNVGLGQAFCNYNLNKLQKDDTVKTIPGVIYLGNESPVDYNSNTVLSNIPIMGTINSSKREYVFLSIYRLLAVVEDFIKCYVSYSSKDDNFNMLISRYGQYRNFQEPSRIILDVMDKNPIFDNIEFGFISEDAFVNELHKQFKEWKKKGVNMSLPLLNRVFIRFYYTMLHVDRDKSYNHAAEKFSAYIIALWNAALVECELENGYMNSFSINLNNTKNIDRIFIDNYHKINSRYTNNKTRNQPSLFNWLFDCPFLRMYVNPMIIYILENETYVEKSDYYVSLLKYDRTLTSCNAIHNKLSAIDKQLTSYKTAIDWINKYWEYLKLKKHLLIYEEESPTSSTDDLQKNRHKQLVSLIENTKKRFLEFEQILRKEERRISNFELSLNRSEEHIRNKEQIILRNIERLQNESDKYTEQLIQLKQIENTTAEFVKSDYHQHLENINNIYRHKLLYENLSQYFIN